MSSMCSASSQKTTRIALSMSTSLKRSRRRKFTIPIYSHFPVSKNNDASLPFLDWLYAMHSEQALSSSLTSKRAMHSSSKDSRISRMPLMKACSTQGLERSEYGLMIAAWRCALPTHSSITNLPSSRNISAISFFCGSSTGWTTEEGSIPSAWEATSKFLWASSWRIRTNTASLETNLTMGTVHLWGWLQFLSSLEITRNKPWQFLSNPVVQPTMDCRRNSVAVFFPSS